MKEIIDNLQQAFTILSRIPVSGDAVDLMAAARQALRAAYNAAEKEGSDASENGQS